MEDPEAEAQIDFVAETANDVPHVDQLEPEALALLEDGLSPAAYVEALVQAEHWNDALGFWARAIPMDQGIRWARACVVEALEEAGDAGPGAETAEVIESIDAWIAEPDDERRRATFDVAQAHGLDTPPAILALAIFLSEGSMSPPDLEPVPAEEGLAHTALAGSVQLASVMFAPEKAPDRVRQFLDRGRALASESGATAAPDEASAEDQTKAWPKMDLESGYDLSE